MKDDCWDMGRYTSQIGNDMLFSKEYREDGRNEEDLVGRQLGSSRNGIDGELEEQKESTDGREGTKTGLFSYREEEASEVKPSMLQLLR